MLRLTYAYSSGTISDYSTYIVQTGGNFIRDDTPLDSPNPKGISTYFNLLVQRAKIEGFIV